MSVNIGHGDRRVIDAITAQATKLQYVQPAFATEIRARLGAKLAEILPGDMDKVFFTLGGAEAIENAIKLARAATGRHKILARYRSYHGATLGAMTLTGDPRRWANEPGIVGVVRYPDTHRWGEAEPRPVAESLQGLEDVIRYEGAKNIAAVFLETIVGTNGILIPPDGYIAGVREICTRNDILMVADEVMAGFGRTGRWFAVDHWDVTPDLMTMAKGLTSSYLPLGAVAMRHEIAEKFENQMFYGGLTYSSHPVSLAASLATIGVYEEDGLIENAARLDPVMREHHQRLAERHPSVGATRNLGLFGIIDLVRTRDPWTPLTPFNGTLGRDEGDRRVPARERAVHDDRRTTRSTPTRRCASPRTQLAEGFDDHRCRPRHRRPGGDGLSDGGPDDRRPIGLCRARRRLQPRPTPGRAASRRHSARRRVLRPRRRPRRLGGWSRRSAASRGGSRTCSASGSTFEHFPPFHWAFAADLKLPHWFIILAVRRAGAAHGTTSRSRSSSSGPPSTRWREAFDRVRPRGDARPRAWRPCSSTRGCSSGPSCRTSSPARRSRSWPSRR